MTFWHQLILVGNFLRRLAFAMASTFLYAQQVGLGYITYQSYLVCRTYLFCSRHNTPFWFWRIQAVWYRHTHTEQVWFGLMLLLLTIWIKTPIRLGDIFFTIFSKRYYNAQYRKSYLRIPRNETAQPCFLHSCISERFRYSQDRSAYLAGVWIYSKENPIYVFLYWELCGLSSNFHFHESVSDVYNPRIGPNISMQQKCINLSLIYE